MSLINQYPRFQNSKFSQIVTVKHLQGEHSSDGFGASYTNESVTAIVMPTSPNDVLLIARR